MAAVEMARRSSGLAVDRQVRQRIRWALLREAITPEDVPQRTGCDGDSRGDLQVAVHAARAEAGAMPFLHDDVFQSGIRLAVRMFGTAAEIIQPSRAVLAEAGDDLVDGGATHAQEPGHFGRMLMLAGVENLLSRRDGVNLA